MRNKSQFMDLREIHPNTDNVQADSKIREKQILPEETEVSAAPYKRVDEGVSSILYADLSALI